MGLGANRGPTTQGTRDRPSARLPHTLYEARPPRRLPSSTGLFGLNKAAPLTRELRVCSRPWRAVRRAQRGQPRRIPADIDGRVARFVPSQNAVSFGKSSDRYNVLFTRYTLRGAARSRWRVADIEPLPVDCSNRAARSQSQRGNDSHSLGRLSRQMVANGVENKIRDKFLYSRGN